MSGKILWVCGNVNPEDGKEKEWEVQGVFDSEEKAVAACLEYHYFVAPVELNKSFPAESVDWPGAYYPLEKKA